MSAAQAAEMAPDRAGVFPNPGRTPVAQVSVMSEPKELTIEQVKERSTRFARRLGYVLFMGTGLLIFVPMILAVASGIKNDQIWDPETGRAVSGGRQEMDCPEEARQLVENAVSLAKYNNHWDSRYREWLLRCKSENSELYDMLRASRQSLRTRTP